MDQDPVDWTAQDWDDLIPRLTLLAALRLARAADSQGVAFALADALEIVERAVATTLSGREPWDSGGESLYQHLALQVANIVTARAGRGAAAEEPDDAWRTERRAVLDHLYDASEKMGELASLMLVEDVHDTAELAAALEVVPVEVGNLRQRMKGELHEYIEAHGQ